MGFANFFEVSQDLFSNPRQTQDPIFEMLFNWLGRQCCRLVCYSRIIFRCTVDGFDNYLSEFGIVRAQNVV